MDHVNEIQDIQLSTARSGKLGDLFVEACLKVLEEFSGEYTMGEIFLALNLCSHNTYCYLENYRNITERKEES